MSITKKPEIIIEHSAYRNVTFYTGNAVTDHQYSWLIRANHEKMALEYPNSTVDKIVEFDLQKFKKILPENIYKQIFDNAMKGISQTVFYIRTVRKPEMTDAPQGILVLDNEGNLLVTYCFMHRRTTYLLMEQLAELFIRKVKEDYVLTQERIRLKNINI